MAHIIIPKMPLVPFNATRETREQMYKEYRVELARLNPGHFNADGTRRSFWRELLGL